MKIKLTSEQKLVTTISLLLVGVFVVVFVLFQETREAELTNIVVDKKHRLIQLAGDLNNQMIQLESDVQTLLITGDLKYQQEVNDERKIIQVRLDSLVALSADLPEQSQKIKYIIETVKENFALTDHLLEHLNDTKILEILQSDDFRRIEFLSDNIQRLIANVQFDARFYLKELEVKQKEEKELITNLMLTVLGVILIVLIYLLFRLRIDFSKNNLTVKNLAGKNEQLETSIFQRQLELNQSKNYFKETIDRITDGFFSLDNDFNYTYVNQRITEMVKRADEELLGHNIWRLFPTTVNSATYRAIQHAKEHQCAVFTEDYFPNLNLWVECNVYPSAEGVSVFLRDITLRKISDQKLLKSHRLYQFISQINQMIVRVERVPILFKETSEIAIKYGGFQLAWIGTWDASIKKFSVNTNAGKWNQQIVELTKHFAEAAFIIKYTNAGQGSTNSYFLLDDLTKQSAFKPLSFSSDIQPFQSLIVLPLQRKNELTGCLALYSEEVGFFDIEEIDLLTKVAADISFAMENLKTENELKLAMREMKAVNERFEIIANATNDVIWDWQLEDAKLWWNSNYTKLFGYDEAPGLKGDNMWANFIHVEDRQRVLKSIWQVIDGGGRTWQEEYRYLKADGTIVYLYDRGYVIRNQEGKAIRMIGSMLDVSERRKTEQELRANQQFITSIVDTSPDIIYIYDLVKGGVVYCNDGFEKILSYSKDEIMAMGDNLFNNLVAAEDFDRHRLEVFPKYFELKDREIVSNTYRILDKQGMQHWVNSRELVFARNEDGRAYQIFGVVSDITTTKIATIELQEKKERLELAEEIAGLGSWEFIPGDANTGKWSVQLFHLLGMEAMETSPRINDLIHRIHEDDRQLVIQAFTNMNGLGEPMVDVFRTNPELMPMKYLLPNFHVIKNQQGKVEKYSGTILDITERVKREQQLRDSEEKYRELVEQAFDAIFIADLNGNFEIANARAIEITQLSREELLKTSIYDYVMPDEIEREPFHFDDLLAGKSVTTERKVRNKDGEYVDIEVNAKIIGGQKILLFIRDIGDRKKAQNAIRESAEKLHQLTAHLINIREEERRRIGREIHDELGQRLTAVKMDISWISKKVNENDLVLKNKCINAIQLLDGSNLAIRRILSELRPVALENQGLIEALSWQGSQFMKNTGIHFELELVEVPSQLPDHVATCIYRVMQEALNNVAKYSHASMVQMRIVKDNDELEVSLEDNGNGFEMAEALKKNSFGVVGMRERVFAIKGTFHIQTAPESGTKIVFRVPL